MHLLHLVDALAVVRAVADDATEAAVVVALDLILQILPLKAWSQCYYHFLAIFALHK
jgi:hypothetical protein